MKKIILIIFIISAFHGNSFAQEKISIAIGDWPPFYSKEIKNYGRDPWIIKEAFLRVGVEVEFGFFPWNRSFNLVRFGKWHATGLWIKNFEREKDFYFSDSVVDYEVYFFHKKSLDFQWETIDDLKKFRISGVKSHSYGEEFDSAEKKGMIQVDRVYNVIDCLHSLHTGRAEIAPMEKNVAYFILNHNFSKKEALNITHHPKVVLKEMHTLLFSKKIPENKKFLDLFNKGLMKIKEDGTFKKIMEESGKLITKEVSQ